MTDEAKFRDDMTLAEARAILRTLVDDGHPCPCCTQLAKVYRRKIHSTMARELIRMAQMGGLYERRFIHVVTLAKQHSPDLVKCRYWGLIERDDAKREDGSDRTGWWRLTTAGLEFVSGDATVPKYARLYDGRCLGLTGDQVSIRDALGKRFKYDELMAGV